MGFVFFLAILPGDTGETPTVSLDLLPALRPFWQRLGGKSLSQTHDGPLGQPKSNAQRAVLQEEVNMKKSVFFGTLAVAGLAAGIASAQTTLEQVQARIEGTPEDSATAPPTADVEPAAEPTAEPAPFVPVEPFALLYIPRLQSDVWAEPLVDGV